MVPIPHLVEELLTGKEPIDQEVKSLVQPVQEADLSLGVMPVMPHELTDDRIVLLFHMSIVILVIGAGTGEGDVPGTTEAAEMSGRGLSPIVRMERDGLPRIPAETGCQVQRLHTLLLSCVRPPLRSIRW